MVDAFQFYRSRGVGLLRHRSAKPNKQKSSIMLVLYDIPSTLPANAWSPNTWKARYALNYKQLPYRTVWIEYPDIEGLALKVGAEPTGVRSGRPLYTLPIIEDPSTGAVIADSIRIVEYLDKTYPDTPQLIIPGTIPLQLAFDEAISLPLPDVHWRSMVAYTYKILTPASQPFFRKTREERRGVTIEELMPKSEDIKEALANVEKGLNMINRWYSDEHRVFLGDQLGYADIQLAALLLWSKKILGVDSEVWRTMSTCSGGRFGKLMDTMREYETII